MQAASPNYVDLEAGFGQKATGHNAFADSSEF